MTLSNSVRLAAAAVTGLLAALAAWWFISRGPGAADLVGTLPDTPGATLYIDVELARRAGLLKYFTAPAAAQDPEYRGFVDATGFDYTRDLDRLAVRFASGGGVWMAASGRFDKSRLAAYAAARGGRCVRGLCSMQGSAPDRQISWLEPEGKTLTLAVSPDPMAAALAGPARASGSALPDAPLWLRVPKALLQPQAGLPPGTSALLSSLEGARQADFRLNADTRGFSVVLDAPFDDARAAEASAAKLTAATELLKKLIARENPQDGGAGLGGVLASGEFKAEAARVTGNWKVNEALLKELAR